MKKYSTLLLSSTLLLASLANHPTTSAEETTRIPQPTTTTSKTTTTSTTSVSPTTSTQTATTTAANTTRTTTTSKPIPTTAVTEAATTSPKLSTQQSGNTLSIFYQRSTNQKDMKIDFAIWSNENGKDDLRWIRAQDYQTNLSLTDFKSGAYTIHAYATIQDKPVFLEEGTLSLTRPKPSLTSSVSEQGILDITVQNIEPGTQTVLVPVWSTVNGQDDLKWYTAQRQANGTYTVRVFLKNHQFATGTYSIHLYTKNSLGQQQFITKIESAIGSKDVPTTPKPAFAIENLQTLKGKYQVAVRDIPTSKPIKSVQVATWSMDKQANLKWRTASLQNGKYVTSIDFQEHQNHTGYYQNHVYVTYTDDTRIGYPIDTINLTTARLPVQFNSKLTSIGNIQATLTNVYDSQAVQIAVWSDENGQDDLKWYDIRKTADRTYSGNIPLNNHKGIGKYHVHAYQNGKGLGAFSMEVTNNQRYLSNNTYPVGQCTWGAKELAPWVQNYWGNANQWAESAKRAGFRTGTTPQIGSVAVWTSGYYGHVAVVTNVESNTRIQVKESNYAGNMTIKDYRGWFNPIADGVTTYIYPN